MPRLGGGSIHPCEGGVQLPGKINGPGIQLSLDVWTGGPKLQGVQPYSDTGHTVLPERLAMMLVRVEAGHTVLPERLAMMLVKVEAGHTVLPERLAMMLVRPHGTTREAGYDVGCCRGRLCGRLRTINFSGLIELPTEWDHSDELYDELLGLCSRRIAQQRTYDKKPLGVAVCYRCCLLYTSDAADE